MFRCAYLFICVTILQTSLVSGADWAQWHGPLRDNISTETGLSDKWPDDGPKMLWKAEGIGAGYSTVSISDGFIYITGMVDKVGMLSKFDMDGKLIWHKPYADEWYRSFPGSRSTATIDDGYAYILSGLGEAVCLDIKTGEKKWSVNTFEKFGGKLNFWGVAESLLVDGGKVVCQAGGKNASIVALNKANGEVIWTTKDLSESVAFCSPIVVDHHGKRQVITILPDSVVGIDIANGDVLWKIATESFRNPDGEKRGVGSTAITPLYSDGCVVVSTGYDHGSAKIRISEDSSKATVVWKNYELDNHHGGIVLVDGMLYGTGWNGNDKGDWFCVDFETGKTCYTFNWDDNKGSVSYADGMLYCYAEESGKVALVEAKSNKFNIVSSFEINLGKKEYWAHPVIFGGRLYIRYGDALMVFDAAK